MDVWVRKSFINGGMSHCHGTGCGKVSLPKLASSGASQLAWPRIDLPSTASSARLWPPRTPWSILFDRARNWVEVHPGLSIDVEPPKPQFSVWMLNHHFFLAQHYIFRSEDPAKSLWYPYNIPGCRCNCWLLVIPDRTQVDALNILNAVGLTRVNPPFSWDWCPHNAFLPYRFPDTSYQVSLNIPVGLPNTILGYVII